MSRTSFLFGLFTALLLSLGGITDAPLVLADAIGDGLGEIGDLVDLPTEASNFRESIGDAIRFLITFVALAAIITIITAGFFLILGFGTEASITKAKKIFIWTIVGILVIFFARVIVAFFIEELPGAFSGGPSRPTR